MLYLQLVLDVRVQITISCELNLLKDAKKEVQLLVDSHRAIWAKVGCTIMGDT